MVLCGSWDVGNVISHKLKYFDNLLKISSMCLFSFLNLPIRPLLVVVFEYQLIALGVWFGEDLGEYGLA